MLFELSRGYQSKRNAARTALYRRIQDAIVNTPKLLPSDAVVAYMGVEDTQAEIICRKIIGNRTVMQFKNAEGILSAVSQGMCRYGILPMEGNVKQLYDQLAAHSLYIVRCCRLDENAQYVCISRALEIYPGADRSSLCMALSDRPGALYKVLSRLYTLGINVVRVESKPIAHKRFHAMFYFDLETSVYSEEFVQLICELDDLCEEFSYLGSYTEVI